MPLSVAQRGVVGLDEVRLALAGRDSMLAGIGHEPGIGRDIVDVVLGGSGAALDDLLQRTGDQALLSHAHPFSHSLVVQALPSCIASV
jgi:hypothetical protein